ncbi:type II secretion system protein M [Vibrio sp. TH_r3]|uniref:type II secretion system protein M n=1 Tax=Vibrio sp. TH_r3 TaxID=3082084 RepID=UPI002952BF4C|nr:type II secretion system protein M [Vibrio sp. TH_r3]MDV7104155.1 type II secretion system protein M [Vibrio sp. TH_r3]
MIGSFTSWWKSISQREQRMLVVCSLAIVLSTIYWGIIQPMSERAAAAQVRISTERQLLNWVSESADRIVALRGSNGIRLSSDPFNQVISKSAKTYKIELIRIQPRDDMLQVWLKPVAFDQFIHWLTYLRQQQGVQVEFMEISNSDSSGIIEVKRLQLKRGA